MRKEEANWAPTCNSLCFLGVDVMWPAGPSSCHLTTPWWTVPLNYDPQQAFFPWLPLSALFYHSNRNEVSKHPRGLRGQSTRCHGALLWLHFGSRRLHCGGHARADRETLSGDLLLLLSWGWASQMGCLGLVPQAANGSCWLAVGLASSLHLLSLCQYINAGATMRRFSFSLIFVLKFFLLAVLKSSCIKVRS